MIFKHAFIYGDSENIEIKEEERKKLEIGSLFHPLGGFYNF